MSDPAVTIIVVSWNTREVLRACLDSVYENAGAVDFEVIVVDNASVDGSAAMVANDFGRVRLIANSENRGFAAANNQGMALARGRYVLLLNSDTVMLDRALEKTVAFAEAHREAAVVGCRVLNPDHTVQRTCAMFPSALNLLLSSTYAYKLFPKSRFWGRELMTYWDRSDIRPVDVVSGCFMLVRREAVTQVGGMDEAFFMYGEETDWCYRFYRAGWKALFVPSACIIHLGGASTRQAASKMRLQLAGSILYFLKKHRSRAEYVVGCLLTALFFLVRIPVWLALGCVGRPDRARAWRTVRIYAAGVAGSLRGYRGLCVVPRGGPHPVAPSALPTPKK